MKHIAFEGIDGAGKTTQLGLATQYLQDLGAKVAVYSYSDKNNGWGRIIKKVYGSQSSSLLRHASSVRPLQEMLYGLSAHANWSKVDINDADVLLADRSILTAYASHVGRLPQWFIDLCEPRINPDTIVYLDIDPMTGMQRVNRRLEQFVDEEINELVTFRQAYERYMLQPPRRLEGAQFLRIDATGSIEETAASIARTLHEMLGLRRSPADYTPVAGREARIERGTQLF